MDDKRGGREARDRSVVGDTVVFVLPWDLKHPGGVNQVVMNLFDTCPGVLGLRPVLFVKSWPHPRPQFETIDGRLTVRARMRTPFGGRRPLLAFLSYLVSLPSLLWRLGRYIHREHVRVVNVHYPDLDALSWLLLRRMKNIRIVLSFHGADVIAASRSGSMARWAWRFVLKRVDGVVVCSDSLASTLRGLGCPPEQITVIRNGVAPATIERHAARGAPIPLPQRYVAALATFEAKKGLDVLLRAFDRIASTDPSLHLVLAGRLADRTVFQNLLKIRDGLAAAERIEFLPNLEHEAAMTVLARATILVLPSRMEPFGIVVLEAGVLTRPVVATAACGVVRYLTPDTELIVVPTEDQAALATALKRLLAAPDVARGMAERLRAKVIGEFKWERIAGEYAPVFGLDTLEVGGSARSRAACGES